MTLAPALLWACEGSHPTPPQPVAPPEAAEPAAPPIPLSAAIVWPRLTAADASGQPVWWFDTEALPTLRVEGAGELKAPEVIWRPSSGGPLTLSSTARRRGTGWLISTTAPETPPEGSGRLCLSDPAIERCWSARWLPPPDTWPALAPIVAAGKAEQHEQVLTLVAAALDEPASGEASAPTAAHARPFLLLARARALWALDRVEPSLKARTEAATAAAEAGLITFEAEILLAAVYFAALSDRPAEARALMRRVETAAERPIAAEDKALSALLAYHRGHLALRTYDLQAARRLLTEALALLAPLGLDGQWRFALRKLAMIEVELGDYDAALALLAQPELARQIKDNTLEQARLDLERGWILASRRVAHGTGEGQEAERLLSRAWATFSNPERLPDVPDEARRRDAAAVAMNLAWLALALNRPDEARQWLARWRALDHAIDVVFAETLEARLAVEAGAEDAAARLDTLAQAARAEGWPWAGVQAAWGHARLDARADQAEAALAHYVEALDRLEALSRQALPRLERPRLLSDARGLALVEEAAALALKLDRPLDALIFLDGLAARALATLEGVIRPGRLDEAAQRRWRALLTAVETAGASVAHARQALRRSVAAARPKARVALEAALTQQAQRRAEAIQWLDEQAPLMTPPPRLASEVQQALGPRRGLVARARVQGRSVWFLVSGTEARVIESKGPPPTNVLSMLLDLDHLYVMQGADAPEAPVALWGHPRGGPLIQHLTLSSLPHTGFLGADLKPDPPGGAGAEIALVVADPSGDLPQARTEGAAVAGGLKARMTVQHLVGQAASRAAFRAGLKTADLVHYAGHGVIQAAEPWAAHLLMSKRAPFDMADIFYTPLQRHPLVVLSSCDTAARVAVGAGRQISLADAFLMAGARAVVAARRPLGDGEAAEFMTHLYSALQTESTLARAWQVAVLRGIKRGDATWQAFELMGRL